MYTNKQWAAADPNTPGLVAAMSGSAAAYCGDPGNGKSTVVLNWAKVLGYQPLLVIGSTHPPEDFSGIPYVMADKVGTPEFFAQIPPEFAHASINKKCLIFLDELTTVRPSKRAPMLSWLSERMICGRKVHEDSIFIAAYNPDTMATDGTPLEKPMANRFFHADWKHDKQSWDAGMIGEEFKPAWVPAAPKRSDWMRFVPKIGSLIVSYTNKNSGELNIIPEDDSQYAFPTPRSWTNLRNAMALAECMGANDHITRELCIGFLGKTVGRTFNKFISTLDLFDTELAINKPMEFKHNKTRPDLTVALMTSVISSLKTEFSHERFKNAMVLFCDNIGKSVADQVYSQLRFLLECKPEKGYEYDSEQIEILTRFGDRLPKEFKERMAARKAAKAS